MIDWGLAAILVPVSNQEVAMPKDWRLTRGGSWQRLQEVAVEAYRCGYCGNDVASDKGLVAEGGQGFIRVCPQCNGPTFFSAEHQQWPGPRVADQIAKLPKDILGLYEEAGSSRAANAFTGAVMLCRKLLMHIAVEKKAKIDESFAYYVEYLITERYAPRGAEGWVAHIKDRANEANHDIVLMTKEDADLILSLTEQLLRNVYELPGLLPQRPASQSSPNSNAP